MKCVYLNDSKIPYEHAEEYFNSAADWAKKYCQSFIGYHIQDVSDVSLTNDFVASYTFKDSKDAMWFEMKYR
jgi:hypothetical protein